MLTDLYVQKPTHSAEEETQYVELALGLIEAVDAPTRAAVVASLSNYPAAPAAILRKLAGTVSPPGSDSPTRAESRPHDLVEMFFAAGSEERRLILANLDVAAEATARRPAPVANELIRRLETAALQRNAGEFGRVLERALGISHALAERIARDRFGEPIVVAARALGMKAAVLQRILLFLNPVIGQSVERVHHLARLFDELAPEAAERMLAIWRKAGGQSQSPSTRRCIGTTNATVLVHGRHRHAMIPKSGRRFSGLRSRNNSDHRAIEEMPSGTVLDFDDPYIRIEANLAHNTCFDIGFGYRRLAAEDDRKYSARRLRLIKDGLRRRAIQGSGAIEPIDLDVYRAGLVGPAPAHRREGSFDVATAHIGRHPDAGFQTHPRF